ncbi:MAG: hypothetical protein QXD98_02340 [Candidatus Diapherotrites archaeon]
MLKGLRIVLKKFAEKVLDVDDTSKPEHQLLLLKDYSENFKFSEKPSDMKGFLNLLKKKHLVDDIVVSTLSGNSLVSLNGDSFSQAISGAALFNYVKAELPKSEAVLVKSNGWHMIFQFNSKLYIVKASSSLTNPELHALAKEIENFIAKNGFSQN